MKILKNELKSELNIRTEKNFPKEGIEFIDIMPLIIQKETFKEIIDKFAEEIQSKKVDYIVGPEARGLIIGAAVANQLNIGFIPVRKHGKLPPSTVEVKFEYEKEYGKDMLELPKLVNEEYEGKSFYIVDDIYATGNTIKAIKQAIEQAGGIIKGEGVIMNIKELNNDSHIYSLLDINEE
ncbi:MAG: adenine phosphoribosyltransferase [Clostridia bacterium]|nr:adenine phosphoribosyltransferase [Clostridia bacterium]